MVHSLEDEWESFLNGEEDNQQCEKINRNPENNEEKTKEKLI